VCSQLISLGPWLMMIKVRCHSRSSIFASVSTIAAAVVMMVMSLIVVGNTGKRSSVGLSWVQGIDVKPLLHHHLDAVHRRHHHLHIAPNPNSSASSIVPSFNFSSNPTHSKYRTQNLTQSGGSHANDVKAHLSQEYWNAKVVEMGGTVYSFLLQNVDLLTLLW
jgi:hypothetical protein